MKVFPHPNQNVAEFLTELKKAIKVIEAHPEMLLNSEESIDYEPIDIEGEPPVHIPINYNLKITLDLDWTKHAKEIKTEARIIGENIGLILMSSVAGLAIYMFITGLVEVIGGLYVR